MGVRGAQTALANGSGDGCTSMHRSRPKLRDTSTPMTYDCRPSQYSATRPLPNTDTPMVNRLVRTILFAMALIVSASVDSSAQSSCDPDGVQASGSIYRICMPASGYNGMLVIWAHGFQDAGTPVSIPEDQLCVNDFCLPEIVNGLGFAF